MPSVVDLLAELVSINSVNASMASSPGEAELARCVAELGKRIGAEANLEVVLPDRPNVMLRLPATAGTSGSRTRRLLFDVHLDTVPLEPMPDALSPVVRDGRMWGRGACDTKSSLAAALVALERLSQRRGPRGAEVCLLGTVDEEYQKRGAMYAVAGGLVADAAVVGEPTNLRPIVAHKGAVRWQVRTLGKAAHTSRPDQGNNAITQMVEVIRLIQERLVPRLASESYPLLTPPTFTVARIEGGIGANIVPDRCAITIDRRTLPREDPWAILDEFDQLMAGLMAARPDINVEREAPFLSERGLETPVDSPVVQAAMRACSTVLRPETPITPGGVPYGTDGTQLGGAAGIPTVVLGPGDIAQAHSADEWVELTQVEAAVEIYYRLMAGFVDGEW